MWTLFARSAIQSKDASSVDMIAFVHDVENKQSNAFEEHQANGKLVCLNASIFAKWLKIYYSVSVNSIRLH